MSGRRSRHLIGVPERVINTLHVEPLDGNHPLIVGQASCQICGGDYRRGDWVKKLPCKHKVKTVTSTAVFNVTCIIASDAYSSVQCHMYYSQ